MKNKIKVLILVSDVGIGQSVACKVDEHTMVVDDIRQYIRDQERTKSLSEVVLPLKAPIVFETGVVVTGKGQHQEKKFNKYQQKRHNKK